MPRSITPSLCPSGTFRVDDWNCRSTCPKGLFRLGDTCSTACPKGWKTCLDGCTTSSQECENAYADLIEVASSPKNQDVKILKQIHAKLQDVMMEVIRQANKRGVQKVDPQRIALLARRLLAKTWVSGQDRALNLRQVVGQPYIGCDAVVKAIPELNAKAELEALKKAQIKKEEEHKRRILEKATQAIQKAEKKIIAFQAARAKRIEKAAVKKAAKRRADKECPDDLGEF